MPTCRICGDELRDDDEVVEVGSELLHPACVDAPSSAARRTVREWAALGSRGQLAMGETQRGTLGS